MQTSFSRFFGFGQQAKLDGILAKGENVTLETIFNEDEILSELKCSNATKFAEFLIKHPIEYQKMIHYVIDDIPDNCTDKNTCIKYPFYVSEIFSAENEKLINYLFEKPIQTPESTNDKPEVQSDQETQQLPKEDEQKQVIEVSEQEINDKNNQINEENEQIRVNLLNQIMQLLENDAIVLTTAGYFSKIMIGIINKKGLELIEYLKHNPDVLTNLIKHSYIKHIVDIFEKLIALDIQLEDTEHKDQQIEFRKYLIERILRLMKGKSHSPVIIENIASLFIELYKKGTSSLESCPSLKELLIYSSEIAPPLFYFGLALQSQQATLYNLLFVQYEFINKISLEDPDYHPNLEHFYCSLVQVAFQALSQQNILALSFETTEGKLITPLGENKLLFIQLLISLANRSELDQFFNAKIFQQIIDLVKQYPNNNQLHLLFEKLIIQIIDSKNQHLNFELFEETNLLLFLIQQNNKEARKCKYGYQGILTKISNYITQHQESTSIKNAIETLKLVQIEWQQYNQELEEINKLEQEWMLGINPRQRQDFRDEQDSPSIIMPAPLISYNYGQTGIRKCESSENNDIVQPKLDDDVQDIEEEIQDMPEEKHEIIHQEIEQLEQKHDLDKIYQNDTQGNENNIKEEYIETKDLIDDEEHHILNNEQENNDNQIIIQTNQQKDEQLQQQEQQEQQENQIIEQQEQIIKTQFQNEINMEQNEQIINQQQTHQDNIISEQNEQTQSIQQTQQEQEQQIITETVVQSVDFHEQEIEEQIQENQDQENQGDEFVSTQYDSTEQQQTTNTSD